MKNSKTKIRTILTITIMAVICSSFLMVNLAYSQTLTQNTQNKSVILAKKTTKTPAKTKKQTAAEKAQAKKDKKAKDKADANIKDAADATKAKTEADQAKYAEAQKKKEEECQKSGGKSCAQTEQDKKEADPNDLTYGTFKVNEVLTLDNGEQPKKYFSDENNSPIVSFILDVINFAITIMGSIAIILFIIAGFMFMLGQGNQQKIDEAKGVIKYAAIGLVVALLSYIIAIFVQSIFVG